MSKIIPCGDDFDLHISGYSKSAVATHFYIENLDMQLDIGGSNKIMKYAFLTHGHSDHSKCLIDITSYCTYRKTTPSIIYMPTELIKYANDYISSITNLNLTTDVDRVEYNMIGVDETFLQYIDEMGSETEILIDVVKCFHRDGPCVGYAFSSLGIPRFIFCGDTTVEFFMHNASILSRNYPVIIIECTFLPTDENTEDLATRRGHIHWNQLQPYVERYSSTTFVLIHFNKRYSYEFIANFFKKEGYENVFPWINSFI